MGLLFLFIISSLAVRIILTNYFTSIVKKNKSGWNRPQKDLPIKSEAIKIYLIPFYWWKYVFNNIFTGVFPEK